MRIFYLDETHKNFAGLMSGGEAVWGGSKLIDVKNSNCADLPSANHKTCDDRQIAIYNHTTTTQDDRDLSDLAYQQVAERLAALYKTDDRAKLTDVYLIACEAGLSVDGRPSLAQKLATALVKQGFDSLIRVHAIAPPVDRQVNEMRVKTIENLGVSDQVAFNARKGLIAAYVNEDKPENYHLAPVPAASFQSYWDLPHNTFTAMGPEHQASFLSMQLMNALIAKRDAYVHERTINSQNTEPLRKANKHLKNIHILIGRLQFQNDEKNIEAILKNEAQKNRGGQYKSDLAVLQNIFSAAPKASDKVNPSKRTYIRSYIDAFFDEKEKTPNTQPEVLDELYQFKGEIYGLDITEIIGAIPAKLKTPISDTFKKTLTALNDYLNGAPYTKQPSQFQDNLKTLILLRDESCFKPSAQDNELLDFMKKNEVSIDDNVETLQRKIDELNVKKALLTPSTVKMPVTDYFGKIWDTLSVSTSSTQSENTFFNEHRLTMMASVVGGVLLAAIGVALMATGVLAPLGVAVFATHAVLYSSLIIGAGAFIAGAILGGVTGELATTFVDEPKSVSKPPSVSGSTSAILHGIGGRGTASPPERAVMQATQDVKRRPPPSAQPVSQDTEPHSHIGLGPR